ncbi:hypothetical protein SDRG_08722 [Saprolegnia diclina VS20]|uniref:HTH CENPB-type domain-containing protein n=1 Tax=Saprolegnia diclina (strain VS20) TaxID=1156394 RepID=T0RTI6_SAPDV|nr:hypothetical protein SDRG_08722 [Saprolegnia diclina VS20]EQC33617.1 hypothetical protein SDRG_08722 [Saprolegnia diclina VS20]|eukprot:XP_008612840.1 hypothetical protein SDRG_08722 [Saprolegnia diclina VS20]
MTPTTVEAAAPAEKKRGKGARLTDEQRMEILETILSAQSSESAVKVPTKQLAEAYGVTPAAIRKLYKDRDVFLSRFATGREGVRNGRKRGGDRAKVEFETELFKWVSALRLNNVALVPSHIQQRALVLAKKYPSMDKFQASWGWYYRFCNRYNVTGALSSEPTSYDHAVLSHDAVSLLHPDANAMGFLVGAAKRKPAPKGVHSEEGFLLHAATAGELGFVECLVQKGIAVDCVGVDGCTPLLMALKGGHYHVLKYLLEHGAKPDATDETGTSALVVAVKLGHSNALKSLLEANAKTETTDTNLKTALVVASEMGDVKAVKLLLKFGANMEATDVDDRTPLFNAVRFGHIGVVDVLIKKGANRVARSLDGLTVLELAETLEASADMMQLLQSPDVVTTV